MIIKTLFFLIPLTAAVAMPLWMARCRKADNRRWILRWLASLAPMGFLVGLHGLGLVPNTFAPVLTMLAVIGAAAFAGGALYLFVPAFIEYLVEARLNREARGEAGESQQEEEWLNDDDASPRSYIRDQMRADMGLWDTHNLHLADDD